MENAHHNFEKVGENLIELFEEQRKYPISRRGDAVTQTDSRSHGVTIGGLPVGSNAMTVSPYNSTDGSTMLAINSHQPTTGPVAWYEAHVQSNEGLNVMGGLFPSGATIGVGFNENLMFIRVNRNF